MSSPAPITVYVKWTHQSLMPMLVQDAGQPPLIYHYDVPICPAEPLRIGSFVKLLLLSNAVYRPPFFSTASGNAYDTYDVHIHGPVINVHEATDHALTLTIRNTLTWSPVQYARISLPHIPNLTVAIDGGILTRTRPSSSLNTRLLELEYNAEIYDPPRSPPCPPTEPSAPFPPR
ncbi:uncharacterized protein BXZ73DRAFT_102074 [Epithele typhae]|uniref:uncharacterized protein n=1 Tax=Epithele typhae TaxID=378194 RepID=UPI0020085DB0|nr:uncharacterized protein BXZ73DRAFT_102074 [Epithele typhae]KAH9929544.1 hypothetical protein BXZ73DRAFT_102074 [Epithele typhae]